MIDIQQIVGYVSENIHDPVAKFIFTKEIAKKDSASPDFINAYEQLKQSKWYGQLADEQEKNGSWGRFHSMDTSAKCKKKFATTESALGRARELSLTKDDPMIEKCIGIMERYIRDDETWTDNVENHKDNGKSHMFCRPFLTAARLNMFDPQNLVVKPLRNVVVQTLKKAFETGCFDEKFWMQKVKEYHVPNIVAPGSFYGSMLLQNSNCMDDALQRHWLEYIWNIKGGIYYLSSVPPAEKQFLDDKRFDQWLGTLELLSGFSLFPEFVKSDVLAHLICETARLMTDEVNLPPPHPVTGHYAESWRDKNAHKNDIILRIARILVKCQTIDVTEPNR